MGERMPFSPGGELGGGNFGVVGEGETGKLGTAGTTGTCNNWMSVGLDGRS